MTSRRTRRGAATLVLCLSLVAVSALAGCSLLAESVHERAAADGPKKDGASRKAPRW